MAASKNKPKLALHQILFFTVGHVLNDLFNAIYTSYLLTFQTKILGLPSNIVGLLWFIPSVLDAPIGLLIGYLSDNFNVPFLSKFYGKRKSWHLVGCTLVGVFAPFVLMPCFFCGDRNESWIVVVYYVSLLVVANIGWGLTQANFLALIPDISKKQSDMVKLGAISSATTLICGIYVYVVTWVLLGRDGSDTLSFSQWKEFMNLVIIVVATGAFFAVIFHLGIREQNAKKGNRGNRPRSSLHAFSMESYEKPQPAPPNGRYRTAHACSVSEVIQGVASTAIVNASFVEEEADSNYNKTQLEFQANNEVRLNVAELENHLWQALSEKNDKRNEEYKEYESDSVESSGYGEDSSLDDTDGESVELFMPETFMDMVPNHSTLILNSRRGSNRVSPFPSPRLSRSASKRIPRYPLGTENAHIHPHSMGVGYGIPQREARSRLNSEIHESPFPTPRLSRCNRHSTSPLASDEPRIICPTGIDPRTRSRLSSETQEGTFPSPQLERSTFGIDPRVRTRLSSETQESPFSSPQLSRSTSIQFKRSPVDLQDISSYSLEINKDTLVEINLNSVAIEDIETMTSKANNINDSSGETCDLKIIDRTKYKSTKTKSWKTLFKNPLFYKLGAAYMFTRLSQNIINSYMPLYLTDILKFEKASIAYFPLVILVSGVFSSIAAKKLNKLLGNKWTFVLGAIAVIGASGWFYLLTEDTRSLAYIPAIVSGSGTSIMFVTSLALAAEFVDADRSSGAFLMASMGFFAKVAMGVLFGLLQEFSPEKSSSDCPECKEYVRHVFSLTPGVTALLGVISFVLFIPATIQCRPIPQTVDAETQTDVYFPFDEPIADTLEIINDTGTETQVQRAAGQNNPDIEATQITKGAEIVLEVPETLDTRL